MEERKQKNVVIDEDIHQLIKINAAKDRSSIRNYIAYLVLSDNNKRIVEEVKEQNYVK